jgi:hypothetical protein
MGQGGKTMIKCIFFCLLILGLSNQAGAELFNDRLYVDFSGTAGFYLLPAKVSGNMADYYYDEGLRALYINPSSSDQGYTQTGYKYEHLFATRTAFNLGFKTHAAYFILPRFGLGFEYGQSFSLLEHVADHTYQDTTTYSNYYYTSYDTRVESIISHDRLYMKLSALGLLGIYRMPWKGKMSLDLGLGMGMANYLQMFQIEYKREEVAYYRNDTLVNAETNEPSFQVFGIKYHSFYLQPQVAVGYPLSKRLSLKGACALPLSFVEKGYLWKENNGLMFDAAVFYPSPRFMAGNLLLSCGLEICF